MKKTFDDSLKKFIENYEVPHEHQKFNSHKYQFYIEKKDISGSFLLFAKKFNISRRNDREIIDRIQLSGYLSRSLYILQL